jgi:Cu-Zn family superoxide dismutase
MLNKELFILLGAILLTDATCAEDLIVPMNLVDSTGSIKSIGTVKVSENPYGTIFTPGLAGLPPGLHGFHMHQNPNCGPMEKDGKQVAAGAAGGHYDPENTGRHERPYWGGHLGDLPALYVGADGKATHPVLAPRVKISDVSGHSLMIHAGGDNHADHPEKLGGGGARLACGVVE